MTKVTETIPVFKVEYLKKSIEKLNRKAVKLGCQVMNLFFDNYHTKKIDYHPTKGYRLNNPYNIEFCDAHLEYEIPTLNGWEFIAVMEIYENIVFVNGVPDKEIPAEYQNKERIKCDHCGINRFRKKSILIRHIDTNEYKEVGSTCVKDFFGGNDPNGFMFMASIVFSDIIGNINDDYSISYGSDGGYGLTEILVHTSAVIRKHGWMSKKNAFHYGAKATAERVLYNINPSPDFLRFYRDELAEIDEKDKEIAPKIIEHFKNINDEGNDYLINLKKIVELGYVPYKYIGYACSMFNAYNKDMERKIERKNELPSEHVGRIGERIKNIKVKVLFVKDIDSYYGLSTLYTMQDSSGNIYKTFYSGSSWAFDKDDEIIITGTVKKHDTFNGKKQTMLNRVFAKEAPASGDIIKKEDFSV